MKKLPTLLRAAACQVHRHATRFSACALVCVSTGMAPQLASADTHWDCNSSYGSAEFSMGQFFTSSRWQALRADGSDIGAVRIAVSSGAAGHQLSLAHNWSTNAVFYSVAIPAAGGTFEISDPSGPIIAFVTHPTGTGGFQATATLCKGSVNAGDSGGGGQQPDQGDDGPAHSANPDGSVGSGDGLIPASQSGLVLSRGLDRSKPDYWARHPGVVNTLSPACIDLHDSYWTKGPDDKAYPTWHPPVATTGADETCYFGHEHGDDPGPSAFYTDAKYQQQRDQGLIPIPFGYANEVYAGAGGRRHEDHFGHKIYRENFETAYGNSVGTDAVGATGSICTAVLKLHQGTDSADALTNHLHETVAHIDCTALPGFPASRVHATSLVAIGRPGWFTNNCGPYRVPGQTNGTRGTGENNAPAGPVAGDPPVALGAASSVVNFSALRRFDIEERIDGERIVPGAGCVYTYQGAGSAKANNHRYGHAMNDTWVRPLMITNSAGSEPRMMIKSYYSVFNPSRVFYIEPDGAVTTRATVEMCRNQPANAVNGPTQPSELCQVVLANGQIARYSETSPYNGTVRNVNFKSLQIGNETGSTEIWTDAFGREVSIQDPRRAIRQYVSQGYNGVAGAGADGTIARPDSVRVCRRGNGPYPLDLPKSDPCYWNGNDDLLFAKEWWRDFSKPANRIHAPN